MPGPDHNVIFVKYRFSIVQDLLKYILSQIKKILVGNYFAGMFSVGLKKSFFVFAKALEAKNFPAVC